MSSVGSAHIRLRVRMVQPVDLAGRSDPGTRHVRGHPRHDGRCAGRHEWSRQRRHGHPHDSRSVTSSIRISGVMCHDVNALLCKKRVEPSCHNFCSLHNYALLHLEFPVAYVHVHVCVHVHTHNYTCQFNKYACSVCKYTSLTRQVAACTSRKA